LAFKGLKKSFYRAKDRLVPYYFDPSPIKVMWPMAQYREVCIIIRKKTRTEDGYKYNTKTSITISTKRTKEHRSTEE